MGWSSCRRLLAVLSASAVLMFGSAHVALASNWSNPLGAGSKGQAQAQELPSAPTGLTASCPAPSTAAIKLVWSAVTPATTYTVYQSTTSASSGFASVKTGLTTPTWTTDTLAAATYWYKVTVNIGSNWASSQSTVTSQVTIHTTGKICKMP